jgi:hypothetical protein
MNTITESLIREHLNYITINPYIKGESIPSTYSQSSKILNIDTFSLSQEAQGKYFGYLSIGMKLVGQSSGAVAYVKDLRLISDNYGDLIGAFYLRLSQSLKLYSRLRALKVTPYLSALNYD